MPKHCGKVSCYSFVWFIFLGKILPFSINMYLYVHTQTYIYSLIKCSCYRKVVCMACMLNRHITNEVTQGFVASGVGPLAIM